LRIKWKARSGQLNRLAIKVNRLYLKEANGQVYTVGLGTKTRRLRSCI
jgi:hypothetical protein